LRDVRRQLVLLAVETPLVLRERLLAAVELVFLGVELELDVRLARGQCRLALLDLLL
jgi:hypothetical protein